MNRHSHEIQERKLGFGTAKLGILEALAQRLQLIDRCTNRLHDNAGLIRTENVSPRRAEKTANSDSTKWNFAMTF